MSPLGLAWQACLKNTEGELELLTDIDVLLMVEKGIRGGISHVIHRYPKAINKYMKNYEKNIKSFLRMGNVSKTACKWFSMSKKLSKFNDRFKKDYAENSNKGYLLELDVEYPKNLFNLHSDLPF